MDAYIKGAELGKGTFAVVNRGVHKESGDVVAIKKIHITDSKEGVHVTALREMKLLKEIHHPNIIKLRDVFTVKKNIMLVLEFMDSDLEKVIKDRSIILSQANIKSYMQMIFRALHACHSHFVVHRDVKPNNCLLAADGTLKLADFGLARQIASPERDPGRPYTHQVFALWYRAPELFFGATSYSYAVDIWAAGCIMAELLLRKPWFPGHNDVDVLGKIFNALGTPTEANWPGVKSLPAYVEFTALPAAPLNLLFPNVNADCLDLLAQCVTLDPRKRPTAAQALQHNQLPKPQRAAVQQQSNAHNNRPTTAPKIKAEVKTEETDIPDLGLLEGSMTPPVKMRSLDFATEEKSARGRRAVGDAGDGDAGPSKPEESEPPEDDERPKKRTRGPSASGVASPALAPDAAGKFSPRPGQTVAS